MSAVTLQLWRVPASAHATLCKSATDVYLAMTEATPALDVGPAWAALHMALTAEVPVPRHIALERDFEWDEDSLENVLMGGDATPYEDELTVARCLSAARVRDLAGRLAGHAVAAFGDLAEDDALVDELPAGWDVARAEAELPARYAELVALYQAAAAAGDGLLLACVPSRAPQAAAIATTAPASPASGAISASDARTRLQRVGFYQELKHGRPDGERLREVVAATAAPAEAQLVRYLQAGSVLAVAPGPVRDVLAAGSPIIGTLSVLTDGTYAWPSDLAHYVGVHHARLPVAFVAHARARGFRAAPVDVDAVEL